MAEKGKPWKFGKKHGIRGTVSAALKHHPEKFSTDDPKKLNPYAVFTAMEKKKKGGIESSYKDQPTTSKKSPKKKILPWLPILKNLLYCHLAKVLLSQS